MSEVETKRLLTDAEEWESEAKRNAYNFSTPVKILRQSGDEKKGAHIIPLCNPGDRNAGVLVRFPPIKHPERPDDYEKGVHFYRVYIHSLELPDEKGVVGWKITRCSGDHSKFQKSKALVDPENCKICEYLTSEAAKKDSTVHKKTLGLPKLKHYFVIFNYTERDQDLKEWKEEGIRLGESEERSIEDFLPPIWLLETTYSLSEELRRQHADEEWGSLTGYRVRILKIPGKNPKLPPNMNIAFQIKPVLKDRDDYLSKNQIVPYSANELESLRRFTEGYVDPENPDAGPHQVPNIEWVVKPTPIERQLEILNPTVKKEKDEYRENNFESERERVHVAPPSQGGRPAYTGRAPARDFSDDRI